jgi:uncharacterized protein YndB with AHSA1/START domain
MSIQFEITETFTVSQNKVFEALVDLDSAREWMPGFVSLEKLTEGEVQVGTEWRETRKMFGKNSTEHFEVTAYEKPRLLGLRVDGSKGTSGKGEFLFTYHIEERDGMTAVRLVGEIRGMSGVMAWVGKLIVGNFKKACAKDFAALKAYLEKKES